jgi:hypothetical protein
MLPDTMGRARWREVGGGGTIAYEVVEGDPERRLVTRIADPDLAFGGTWTYELAPEDGGTRLSITEHGEIYNPLFRFIARFILGYSATLETYLADLARHLAADPSPTPAATP